MRITLAGKQMVVEVFWTFTMWLPLDTLWMGPLWHFQEEHLWGKLKII